MSDFMKRCEQRKQFKRGNGEYEWIWTEVAVSDALGADAGDIRCLHCRGAVRLHRQLVPHGPEDHVEHRSRQDSEHCKGGSYFKGEHRLSLEPVR